MVEAVVIGTVALGVVGRGEDGHLVTVHRVTTEEMLHFLRNLQHITSSSAAH